MLGVYMYLTVDDLPASNELYGDMFDVHLLHLEIGEMTVENKGATCIRSSRPEVFLGKGVLKICSKFTGEHPCRSAS